jgi:GNAT superfamily N-acetyltransferase
MLLGNTPFMATHVSGDTAWVDPLFVPRDQRNRGWGRRMFAAWVAQLPPFVRKIELLAVDLDGGSPIGFWRKLGFDVEEAEFEEVPETGCYMVKPASEAVRSTPSASLPSD